MAAALEDFIAQESPDLIVSDPMLWGGMAAAEASGLPWASVAYTPKLFRAINLDVRGPGLRPPRGLFGLLAHRCIEAALRDRHRSFLPLLNAVRTARGLPNLSHPWDWFHLPPLTIATTAEPFEYPRTDWHPSLRFVGPLEWEPIADPPGWLNELDDRPLILLVGSSIPETGPAQYWVRTALQVLADEPYQVVATLPTENIPESLAGNIRVVRFAPHGLLLPRAACVICHGGPGITQKALAAGVPVLAVPFAYDRFEVARRVEVAGAGVMVPGSRLTRARMKGAVRRTIKCRPGAQRIAEAFRQAGGAVAAADALEQMLVRGAARPWICSTARAAPT